MTENFGEPNKTVSCQDRKGRVDLKKHSGLSAVSMSSPSWMSDGEDNQNVFPDASAVATRRRQIQERWKQSETWRNNLKKQVGPVIKKSVTVAGNQLQKVNLGRLIDEMEHDQEVADKLEFINQETKEEAQRKELVREATEACQREIENHLEEFLERRPDATYEDWILELHPDNVEQGYFFEEFTQVDIRFYLKDSDHRLMWNANEKVSKDRHVAARSVKHSSSQPEAVDFLDNHPDSNTAPSTDGSSSDSAPNFTEGTAEQTDDESPTTSWSCNGDLCL